MAGETDEQALRAPESPETALAGLAGAAQGYAQEARAPATRRAYQGDWDRFQAWATLHGLAARPAAPETIGLYLAFLAQQGRKVSTIDRALAAISCAHGPEGRELRRHPAVREVLAGIHRTKGVAPKKKRAIENDLLAMLVATITGEGLRPARDRALLLLGWTLGCRRSELAQLDIEHVAWVDQGLRVLIARGKTDQEGAGRHVGIPHAAEPKLCPVRQLRAYLDLLGAEQGPLFRRVTATGAPGERLSPKSIADVVKRAAGAAGFPADDFGGHSLRAGFITAAYRDGKSLAAIMQHTGHRSERVALGYVRLATLFDDNPADGLL